MVGSGFTAVRFSLRRFALQPASSDSSTSHTPCPHCQFACPVCSVRGIAYRHSWGTGQVRYGFLSCCFLVVCQDAAGRHGSHDRRDTSCPAPAPLSGSLASNDAVGQSASQAIGFSRSVSSVQGLDGHTYWIGHFHFVERTNKASRIMSSANRTMRLQTALAKGVCICHTIDSTTICTAALLHILSSCQTTAQSKTGSASVRNPFQFLPGIFRQRRSPSG